MLGGTAFSLPVIRAGSLDHYLNIRNIFIPILLDKLIDDIEVDQLVGKASLRNCPPHPRSFRTIRNDTRRDTSPPES